MPKLARRDIGRERVRWAQNGGETGSEEASEALMVREARPRGDDGADRPGPIFFVSGRAGFLRVLIRYRGIGVPALGSVGCCVVQ